MLTDEDLPAQYRDDLTKINRAASNGADLVHRLLAFSRKSEARPRPINLNRHIEQLKKMLSRTIPKMIEIELVLDRDLSAMSADPTQMEQILMNLSVNARDAMPEGGKLIIRTENVTLDEHYAKTHLGAEPGAYVLLSVSDTGQGMDKDTVQHIFEPFFTTKGPGEGTGLGLAMVYGIVKQHGGHIMCYSEAGKGTIFKMYFPAMASDEGLREAETKTPLRGGSETILLVDDEEMIRDLGARILTNAGYSVITASNGKEALKVYRERYDEISLVVLDLIMQKMGGMQCLEGLLRFNKAVKIVIASGYSGNDTTRDALAAGAKGFVNKPYDIRQVLEVVRTVLDEKPM
jgi:CheY-like chemotaxis protein